MGAVEVEERVLSVAGLQHPVKHHVAVSSNKCSAAEVCRAHTCTPGYKCELSAASRTRTQQGRARHRAMQITNTSQKIKKCTGTAALLGNIRDLCG